MVTPTVRPAPTIVPTATPTATPLPPPTPQPPTVDSGDWMYFGPDCPAADLNCAPIRSDIDAILLPAHWDSNEPEHDRVEFSIVCFANDHPPAVALFGGGPRIGGNQATYVSLGFADEGSEGESVYWTEDNDPENIVFITQDAAKIIAFLEDADSQDRDMAVGIVGDDVVVAEFDPTGFRVNHQQLPCVSTEAPIPTSTVVPAATATPTLIPATGVDALTLYDDNGNGRITCAEARNHGIAPVRRGHPAYQYMNDRDGDGIVCE